MIRTLDARRGIDDVVAMLARAPAAVAPEIHRAVDEILAAVRARGDAALQGRMVYQVKQLNESLTGRVAIDHLSENSFGSLVPAGLIKTAIFIVLSPIVGFLLAFTFMVGVFWLFHRYRKVEKLNRGFRRTQLVSAAAFSLGHGANDAQKTMGVIALALFANGNLKEFEIPTWVKIAAGLSIALGTYVGGWRIMRTLGQRLYKIEPESGFAAQAAAGATIYAATKYGYPLSTTHVISGAVLGAGATQRLSAVRWGVAGNIVGAWILTIPAAASVAAAFYWPIQGIF